jgi:LmbE family N-acetylglucosaminyl deacetylase
MFGKRILVLAAHPDDEVVACAAAVGRAQAKGAEIFVLFLTHGCIAQNVMWPWQRRRYERHVARRRAESEAAAKLLNITPLGWSLRPARHLWRELSAVYNEALTAADQNKIDQIWVPAYEGGNADHDALNAAGSLLRVRFNVLEFSEYNYSGRKTRSQQFPHPNASEQTITLTPAETEKKEAALALYKSEQGNLGYVKTRRECWRPLAAYDYSRPPHAGKLWYARFQWVPFRHPRVDFTDPADVSAAIVEFLKNPGA